MNRKAGNVSGRDQKAKRISIALRCAWADPEKRANLNTWSTPSVRQRRIEGIKRARNDPERRTPWIQHLRDACKKPLTKRRRSLAQRKRWQDPKNRQQSSAAMRRAWADPEKRQAWEASNKRANRSPEKRAKLSAGMKAFWANPANRRQRTETMQRAALQPEIRALKSQALKRLWAERSAKLAEAERLIRGDGQTKSSKRSRGRKGELLGDTSARITMSAYRMLLRWGKRRIAAELYPLHTQSAAWNAAKNNIFKRHEEKIRLEKSRLAGLPDAVSLAAFQAAKSGISGSWISRVA